MSRVIFHIDVNSAFLSWTAVKIVREGGQDIRLVPSVVSGVEQFVRQGVVVFLYARGVGVPYP